MARITRPSSHRSQDKRQAKVFIPPDRYNFEVKVNVTLSSGTVINLLDYDSTPFVTSITCRGRSLMKGFNDATIMIQNPMGKFNSLITGGETINIIAEYTDSTPTNNIFNGRIDGALKLYDMQNGFQMKLICRQKPEVQDKYISKKADNITGDTTIKEIVDDDFSSNLTYTNMSGDMSTLIKRSWALKPGSKIITEIFDKCGHTGYIDENGDIHSWSLTDEDNKNDNEFIAFGINCNAVMGFGTDLRNTKNHIIATGDRVEGSGELFYVWNKKDSDDISDYWEKTIVESDNVVNSQDEIENEASLAYERWTRTDTTGTLVSMAYGLETLRAGQRIPCYVPHCDVDGYYIVHEYTHTILPAQGEWKTIVRLEKFGINLIDLLKNKNDRTKGNVLASLNPNAMVGGYAITFSESTAQVTHDDTEINNSTLRLQTGQSQGTATSLLKEVDSNITEVEIRLRGEDLGSSTVDVTVDNGITWETNIGFNTNNSYTITSSSANKKRLKYRINLVLDSDNADPRVWSASCMFKS